MALEQETITAEGAATTPEETPAPPATPPPAPSLSDDSEFDIDGEKVKWKDLRTQRMLHADYTRKRQADAEARRAFESERASFEMERQQVAQAAQALRDPSKLAEMYLALQASRQSEATPTAPDPATIAQTVEQKVEARLQQFMQQMQTSQQTQKISEEIDGFTRGVLKDHPALAAIDGIEEAIYAKVKALRPESLDDMKAQIKLTIASRQEALDKYLSEAAKRTAVAAGKAANGIDRGGQPTVPTPKKYKDLDDPARTKDMIAFFEQALRADGG